MTVELSLVEKGKPMENHINLSQPTNHYLQHFYVALTNFEQLTREDRERRRLARVKKLKQKQYE